MKKIESVIEYCRNRIRRRMYLNVHPDITVKIRNFEGPDRGGHYKIQPSEWNVIEPSEFWCEAGAFNGVKGMLKEGYPQLHKDTDRNVPFSAYLIEPIVCIGSSAIKISGGFNWVIIGVLKNGEKYCAVLDVEVRPLLRRCGLMTLMKHAEFELARREQCDFIQTWHMSDNPDFNAAIVPSLKRGFILYHGPSGNGEDYEDIGQIHLRHYFDRRKRRNVRVMFKDGKEFMSPAENSAIVFYLESCPDIYTGKTIRKIQEYGKGDTKIRRRKEIISTEKIKSESDMQRIFLGEGTVGFEYTRQRNTHRVGDSLTLYPAIELDHFVKSDRDVPYMKHVIYNIYEFCFKPEAEFFFKYADGIVQHEFIISLLPGFRARYSEYPAARKRTGGLKVGQWYEGCGRLSICDHRYSAYYKTPSYINDITTTGKLVSILKDAIMMDFSTKYSHLVKQFRYGKEVYGPEDALEWFGYYRDLKEFKKNVATYIKNPVEYESTDLPEPVGYSPNLIFQIEIKGGSLLRKS